MRYRLAYDDIELGEVRYVDSDFPSSFGAWTPSSAPGDTTVHQHLYSYIEYSILSMRILDTVGDGPEWQEFAQREEQFLDIIECDRWWLIEEDGTRVGILIPIFREGGEITWRYDPTR